MYCAAASRYILCDGVVRKRRGFTKVIELNVVMPVVMRNVGKRFAERQDVVAGDGVTCVFHHQPLSLYIFYLWKSIKPHRSRHYNAVIAWDEE